ncbi:MAG: hypothetical protein ACLGGX_12240, partial [Bdellovibrionia bacterium]
MYFFKNISTLASLSLSLTLGSWYLSSTAHAQEDGDAIRPTISVNPSGGASLSAITYGGNMTRTDRKNLRVHIHNKCHAENLRFVANPISRNANIVATITLEVNGKPQTVTVNYPSAAAQHETGGTGNRTKITAGNINAPAAMGVTGKISHSAVYLNFKVEVKSAIDANGDLVTENPPRILGVSFSQDVIAATENQPAYPVFNAQKEVICNGDPLCDFSTPQGAISTLKKRLPLASLGMNNSKIDQFFVTYGPDAGLAKNRFSLVEVSNWEEYNNSYNNWYRWFNDTAAREALNAGPYRGNDGPLTVKIESRFINADKNLLVIVPSFPGENGFCRGFYSPLMAFFDDKKPKFNSVVEFPLNPSGKTYWPEKNTSGSFIAFDRNGNGKIDAANELFGSETGEFKNGFEALREFDSNGDGLIDSKDSKFANLLLWNDKNSNGKSEKSELVKLSSKIKNISLNYNNKDVRSFSDKAEAR